MSHSPQTSLNRWRWLLFGCALGFFSISFFSPGEGGIVTLLLGLLCLIGQIFFTLRRRFSPLSAVSEPPPLTIQIEFSLPAEPNSFNEESSAAQGERSLALPTWVSEKVQAHLVAGHVAYAERILAEWVSLSSGQVEKVACCQCGTFDDPEQLTWCDLCQLQAHTQCCRWIKRAIDSGETLTHDRRQYVLCQGCFEHIQREGAVLIPDGPFLLLVRPDDWPDGQI